MKQQLIVRFIVYMIMTVIFTSFYYVIGPETSGSIQQTNNNFQPFPDILPSDLGVNEISNDLYAANVHQCSQSNAAACANGYVCKRPGTHLYKDGVKLNPRRTYCLPDNLILNQQCNTYLGKYVWSSDGGVSSMTCQQSYPNLYDASQADINIQAAYPCNINKDGTKTLQSSKNNLMNSESMYIYKTDNDNNSKWELQSPYSISWDPYYNGEIWQQQLLSNFTPYDTVCEWYNHLDKVQSADSELSNYNGIEAFAKYSQTTTTPTSLLFSQNNNLCGIYDPDSYKCYSYSDQQCATSKNCAFGTAPDGSFFCKPKCSKIVDNANDCDEGCTAHPFAGKYYCSPPPSSIKMMDEYLKVLPKIRSESGEKVPRKPLWNCRCMSNTPSGNNNNNGAYCQQLSPSECKNSTACKQSYDMSGKPICIVNEDLEITSNSILYPQNKYTCNAKTCWGGGAATGGLTQASFQGTFSQWNPCKDTTSEYDCKNKKFITASPSVGCVWENNTCTMPFVTPTGVNNVWNDNLMTEYWCDFYGRQWMPTSSIPPSYISQLSEAGHAPGGETLLDLIKQNKGICLNEGYSCSCTNTGLDSNGLMKSNINGFCYPSNCGFIKKEDTGIGASFGFARLNTSNPMEPFCQCGGSPSQGQAENGAIYCNSELIDNNNMCSKYQDYDSCEGMTGGWCKWDKSDEERPCKNVCESKTTAAECIGVGINKCQWDDSSNTCSLVDCEANMGKTTGQYCNNECFPSTCNDSVCSMNVSNVDQPTSIMCSRATKVSSGLTSSLSGECVPEIPGMTIPWGDPQAQSPFNSLSNYVNDGKPLITSNTFCNSTGLGMSQPVSNTHMNFKVNNPYYTPDNTPYNSQTEIHPNKNKMACAKGFRPVKWNTQLGGLTGTPDCGASGGRDSATQAAWHNDNCQNSARTFDPSQAWPIANDSGEILSFTYHGNDDDDSMKPSNAAKAAMDDYNSISSGTTKGMLWSGKVGNVSDKSSSQGWNTYNILNEAGNVGALGDQTCAACSGFNCSCDNMRGEGPKDWFHQDDTFALTGNYKFSDGELQYSGRSYRSDTVDSPILFGSSDDDRPNYPACNDCCHCGDFSYN